MATPRVTIAVVPRERFSVAPRSLSSILEHLEPSHEVVYVDGGSPPLVRQFLEQRAARHGFRLLSTERYVSPNTARNLAAAEVRTKYVAFVDNDIVISAGWLAPLVECAEETGAWIVGGVCCEHEGARARIVAAGGTAEIAVRGQQREFQESEPYRGQRLADARGQLRREAVGQVALHATLVRTDVFHRLGPLDEQLLSAAEDTDLCLLARERGGEVYREPASVVTQVPPPPFDPVDVDYFQLRWSDAWNRASLEHFRQKWQLSANDRGLAALADALAAHRRLILEPYRRLLRVLGRRPAEWIERKLIAPLEQAANRRRFPSTPDLDSQRRKAA